MWTSVTSSGTTSWSPNSTWGWQAQTYGATGYLRISSTSEATTSCNTDGIYRPVTFYTVTYGGYVDQLGTFHHIPDLTNTEYCENGVPVYTGASGTADDGSGYSVVIEPNLGGVTVTARNGGTSTISVGAPTVTDANGNQITIQTSGSATNFFDTLSSTTAALTMAGTAPNPVTYTYVAPSSAKATYAVSYKTYTVQTNFQCTNIVEYAPTSASLVNAITLPDGTSYQFTYETTPISGSKNVTGRIASVQLPTGGTISYAYTGSNNGINCSDGSTTGLTRTLNPGGEWQYVRTQQSDSAAHWQTEVTTPPDSQNPGAVGDNTIINFQEDSSTVTPPTNYFFETERQIYQGTASSSAKPCSSTNTSNCLLLTTTSCYNAHYTNCATISVASPIMQTDYYAQPAGGTTRLSETLYNSYGLVTDDKEYNYGATTGSAPGTTQLIQETSISYATLGNGIVSEPASVTVYDRTSGPQVTLASSTYTYDNGTQTGGSLTGTSGTPQHVSVTGSRGNLTAITTATSSSVSLTQTFSYYDTGNVNVATDVNGATTTYTYGACGNSFPTLIAEPVSLSRSMTWNCTGGVATGGKDENGNSFTMNYTTDTDFWRPNSVVDQIGNTTDITYSGETAVETALQNFNGGKSAYDFRTTLDGFGRVVFNQQEQGPSATNYDTSEIDYNNLGQPYITRMPYSAAASPSNNSSAPATTTTYDALGRVLSVTDADGGTVTYTYTNNDVLQTVGGTSGTPTFQKQFEYDGLGRLTSVCEITAGTTTWPGGACAQSSSQTGYWTRYQYDAIGHLTGTCQNTTVALATNCATSPSTNQQTRTFTYDLMGRMTSESNPETGNNGVNGTIIYTYDISTCATTPASGCGDLTQRKDNAGNTTSYTYDALHRLLTAGNSAISGATLRNYFYDSKSSYPKGITINNAKTQMVEAQTTNPSGTTILTDEFFSYDADGRLTDVYESTPHSGEYYHTTASYWPTGYLNTLSGIPGVPTLYYGTNSAGATNLLDGEGRYLAVDAASGTSPVTSVTYSTSSTTNPLGALTGVTYGSLDSDSFTYDPNTGRAGTYTFEVNGNADTGTLNWYTNGTLNTLAINNQIPNTTDSQTCTYTYDGMARVSGSSCTSSPAWSQTFTYDPFGNIAKSGNITFDPSYSFTVNGSSVITNQFFSIPGVSVNYDANGNLLTDNLNTYTWDQNWGNPASVNSTNLVYDALGRMVEQQNGSTYTEILYSALGKTAMMNGSSLTKAFVYLPGGGTAIYNSSGLAYYRHPDWLGSSRLTSTQARGLYSSTAYAPFGEQYATSGTADPSFTGQNSDTVPSLYDFTFREHSMSQGRWISPDPAGLNSVDPTSPQTWNRYAYVVNSPLTFVDLLGLDVDCYDVTYVGFEGGYITSTWTVTYCSETQGGEGPSVSAATTPLQKPCRIVDPALGALEFTVKFGPEVQLGPAKVGASFYKNLMTGGTGAKLEANTGVIGVQADSPTPEGGSFGGGGPGNNQYSLSLFGFQLDLSTGSVSFNPSKSFTLGAQLLLGGEVSFNSDKFKQLVAANAACRAQGGS